MRGKGRDAENLLWLNSLEYVEHQVIGPVAIPFSSSLSGTNQQYYLYNAGSGSNQTCYFRDDGQTPVVPGPSNAGTTAKVGVPIAPLTPVPLYFSQIPEFSSNPLNPTGSLRVICTALSATVILYKTRQ